MRPIRIVVAAVALLSAAAGATHAQRQSRGDQPLYFKADRVAYDSEGRIVTAEGRVEAWQGDEILLADALRYDERADVLTVQGNVAILQPSGDVMFADRAELTGDFKDGVARDLRFRLADNSRVAAAGGRRVGGTRTEMNRGVYSRCEPCAENPERAPIWQVKADKAVHDSLEKTVEYTDATLELFGVPVAYTPYFSHPDPTVKRQSGFLTPTFGNDSLLGTWIRTPYYYEIAPSRDVTISPMFMTNDKALLAAQYRERFARGYLDMTASFAYASGEVGRDEPRGHLEGIFRYDIDDTWRAGADISAAADDTYRRRYKFGSEQTLVNRAYVEGFRGRSYAAANAFYFQGMRQTDDQGEIPLVLPFLAYNFVGQPDRAGGRWTVDANMLLLTRTSGTDSRRMSVRTGWERPYISGLGEVYTLSGGVQTDAYLVDDVARTGGGTESGFAGRVFPHVALDWRLPFVRAAGGGSQTLEPVAGLVAAPDFGNSSRIPNEDSIDFDLDDYNITSANMFGGFDRVAPGPRAYYGLRAGWYGAAAVSATSFIGQSYRFTEQDDFPARSGFDDELSDVVGRVDVAVGAYFASFYRFRLDKDDLTPRRSELAARLGPPVFNVSADYIFFDRGVGSPEFVNERQEIVFGAASRLTAHWVLAGNIRRDLANDRTISQGVRLLYEDECVLLHLDYSQTFTEDRDIQPRSAYIVRVTLKTLGSFGVGTNG